MEDASGVAGCGPLSFWFYFKVMCYVGGMCSVVEVLCYCMKVLVAGADDIAIYVCILLSVYK